MSERQWQSASILVLTTFLVAFCFEIGKSEANLGTTTGSVQDQKGAPVAGVVVSNSG